ncbi:MAG: hypothetical protein PHG64_02060 [Paludibacter sp.]|nr:hypothetical protein [Paludibacter sp.]
MTFLFILLIVSCEPNDYFDEEQYKTYIKDKLDCMNMPRPDGSYYYPVLPGMEKWKSFSSTQEMIDACQVPITILKKQTTQAVFQALWEYPFFFEITYRHNHYQQDFETVFSNTNAYKEFLTRKDAGQCLYSRLLLVNPIYVIYSRGLELFMSQPVFLQPLSIDSKKKIIDLSFKNDSLRQAANQYGEDVSREITWLLVGRTLFYSDYKPFVDLTNQNSQLMTFLESSTINVYTEEEYANFFQVIISNGKDFIH